MDVRPDGEWRYTMHGPDGVDYPNLTVYHEITRPERLVYTHGAERRGEPSEFHVTITLVDQGGGKTKMTMHSVFASPTELERSRSLVLSKVASKRLSDWPNIWRANEQGICEHRS